MALFTRAVTVFTRGIAGGGFDVAFARGGQIGLCFSQQLVVGRAQQADGDFQRISHHSKSSFLLKPK